MPQCARGATDFGSDDVFFLQYSSLSFMYSNTPDLIAAPFELGLQSAITSRCLHYLLSIMLRVAPQFAAGDLSSNPSWRGEVMIATCSV